jgi:hypothetical protein
MNCYEWQHNITLTEMSVSVNCSYQEPNPDNPESPIEITIQGTQTWPDVGPPYPRKAMRCATGYQSFWAKKSNWNGLGRFFIYTNIQSDSYFSLQVSRSDGQEFQAAVHDLGTDYALQLFVSGYFKPENEDDPFWVCGDGVWRKSTGVTKAFFGISSEDGELLAIGEIPRIESGAQITFFRPDETEESIGTGTLNYNLA